MKKRERDRISKITQFEIWRGLGNSKQLPEIVTWKQERFLAVAGKKDKRDRFRGQ